MIRRIIFSVAILALSCAEIYAQSEKLSGTPIGTQQCVDYNNMSSPTTTVNTVADAFDGNFDTCFASWARSYTWCGLDLGTPHVITKVGWSPRIDGLGNGRVKLAMFQGANDPDFMDAIPLYLVTEEGQQSVMSYGNVECSRAFRYVRYVGPHDARCNVSEVEFFGYESEGDDSNIGRITNLPTVVINTVNAVFPYDKEHDIVAQVTVLSSENGAPYTLSEPATVRLRGNMSMTFDKKPFRIKFDKKQNILPDAPATAKKWTLINNYGDKSLIRNAVAFEASRLAGLKYTPYLRMVDVVVNGEYQGLYQLCDQVEVNPGRVEVTEIKAKDELSGDAITGGYFVEVDAYAYDEPAGTWFETPTRRIPVTVKSPDDDVIKYQHINYIRDFMSNIGNLLYTGKYDDVSGYRKYFDVQSFLRHFIVGEFSGNTDTYWSTYFYKDRNNDILYCGPVWDFDIAFDNDYRTYPIGNKADFVYRSGGSAANGMKDFVDRVLYYDPTTKNELMETWSKLRNSHDFTPRHFTDYIDNLSQEVARSAELNFMRWPILNQKVHMNPKTYLSYDYAVKDLRSFCSSRIYWLDNKIGYDKDIIDTDGIFSVRDEALTTYLIGNQLFANTSCDVYDVTGLRIGKVSADSPLSLPTRGLYIVTKPGKSVKVLY